MTSRILILSLAAAFLLTAVASAAPRDVVTFKSRNEITDFQTRNAKVPAGSAVFRVDRDGNVFVGPNERIKGSLATRGEVDSLIADFAYIARLRRIQTRSVLIRENGDMPDLALGRAGDSGAYPNGNPAQVKKGEALGRLYWQGYDGVNSFTNGDAAIYARAMEDTTQTAHGAQLAFATTPLGGARMIDRVVIQPDGGTQLRVKTTNGAPDIEDFQASVVGTGLIAVDRVNKRLAVLIDGEWFYVDTHR